MKYCPQDLPLLGNWEQTRYCRKTFVLSAEGITEASGDVRSGEGPASQERLPGGEGVLALYMQLEGPLKLEGATLRTKCWTQNQN